MLSYIVLSVLPLSTSLLARFFRGARPVGPLIALATFGAVFWIAGRAFPEEQVSEVQLSFESLSRLALTMYLMLAALAVVYGWLAGEGEKLFAVSLATTGFLGLAFSLSKDLLAASVAFELAALAAAFGIGLYAEGRGAQTSALRYVSYVIAAGVCLVGGVSLATRFEVTRDPAISQVTFALLSVSWLIVLGVFPFHLWFPKALARGQLAIVMLLASTMGVGGTWLLLQTYASFPWLMIDLRSSEILTTIAALGTVAASLMAIAQRRLDHLIAYSVAANAGTAMAGIATAIPLGIVGGMFTLLSYLWATLLMLVCLGMSHRIGNDGVSTSAIPRASAAMLGLCLGGLALAGAPPTGGFVGRWMIYQAIASQSGFLVVLLIGSSALLFLAHARFVGRILIGPAQGEKSREEPFGLAAIAVLLAILSLVVGLYPTPIVQVMAEAIAAIPAL